MKTKTLILAAAAMVAAHAAVAQTTVYITGATAFRVATLNSIAGQYTSSGQPFKIGFIGTSGSFSGANQVIFEGSFPGVSGTTIVNTSFNGSVEGLKALVDSPASDPSYLDPSVLAGITAATGGSNGGQGVALGSSPATATAQSDIAFSDVSIASTPFAGNSLQPSNPEAGVVTFTMIANEGATGILSNMNTQNFRALFARGFQPLKFFTGNPADSNVFVFAAGRNDGSGTRTAYLAETGYGIANTVNQYIVGSTSGDTITAIYRVPAGGTSAGLAAVTPALSLNAANASTIWGQDVDGNGGYVSGSSLRNDMGRTSAATRVYDVDGTDLFGAPVNIHLVSWLSTGDAASARSAGAVILGYNGVRLDGFATNGTLSAADVNKVTQGAYTAWSYQQMYRRNDITTGPKVTVYNNIKNNLVLGSSGIATSVMQVSRQVDGGVVAP